MKTSRSADGQVVVEEIPLTLEILLNPQEDIQVPQGNAHFRFLSPLALRLQRFLERRRGWGVYSDVPVTWAQKHLRPVSPDVTVVDNIADPKEVGWSLDVAAEGCRVRAVFEVVSTTSKDEREKDEKHNKPLFAEAGVEEYVLLYPKKHRKKGDRPVKHFVLEGSDYQEQKAAEGWFLLRSLNVKLKVSEDDDVLLEDIETGEPILTWDKEETLRMEAERLLEKKAEARREAENRTARLLLSVLENRGFDLDDHARQRVLDCRDPGRLDRWVKDAFDVATLEELWAE